MKPVCDAFLGLIFKFVLPCLFLKLRLALLLNMQKTIRKTMKEQRMKRQRKTKKIIFNSKIEFVRGRSFTMPAKKYKFRTPTWLFPSMNKHPILI